MPETHPIVKCFTTLCFGAALLLVLFEWHDPFVWEPIKAASQVRPEVAGKRSQGWFEQRQPRSLFDWFVNKVQPVEVPTKIVVSLSSRQVDLYQKKQLIKRYVVAIGQGEWETPVGTFTVYQMQKNPAWEHPITGEVVPAGADNPLGTRWIGFLQKGTAHIGLHGTNQADLIGQAVSHGCIRMRDQDIAALYEYVQIGTVVVVQP